MRAFLAFIKKELLECVRSGKLLILAALFCAFGIMNPAIAKLTPWLLEIMGEQLAENGMIITEVTVDALTSWTQFFKNIPMAFIAFVLVCGGIFTREYESGTLILVLTKGLSRYKVVLAKASVMTLLWSALYWLCFGITYGYNAYFWDNAVVQSLLPAVVYWWLFGVFAIALLVFFSIITKTYGGVLLCTGGCIFGSYILSSFPKIAKYLPTHLTNNAGLLVGAEKLEAYTVAVVITALLSVTLIAISIPLFNKKQL